MGCAECGDKKGFTPPVIEITNPEQLILFRKVVVPSSMGGPDEFPPAIGKYKNVLLFYEKTTEAYLYSSDGIPTAIGGDLSEILARLDSLDEGLADETADREEADNNLQEQIESIRAASDVVDIVGTYRELEEYDTSKLGENDIIRVLVDETHDGATSYYRWTGGEWEFIGALGPFYTQDELDQMFEDEADARDAADSALSSSIDSLSSSLSSEATARAQADTALQNAIDAEASARQSADAGLSADIVAEANARSTADAEIEQAWQDEATARGTADQALQTALNNEITARTTADSAIETRIGTIEAGILSEHDAWTAADTALSSAINNEVTARQNADTALQTAIDGKQNELTAGTGIDITDDVISVTNIGPTVVQTTGTSTTDVMSQNATTSMIYPSFATDASRIRIRGSALNVGAIAIGENSYADGDSGVAIGWSADARSIGSVGLGKNAKVPRNVPGAVALGSNSAPTQAGQIDVSSSISSEGYSNSNYRLLTGLYDPQSAHDAATKGYVDTGLANAGTAFTNAEFNSIFDTSLTEGA